MNSIEFFCALQHLFYGKVEKTLVAVNWTRRSVGQGQKLCFSQTDILPPFNISRNIDFQPGFLKIGWTKINFDNGFEFLRSFSWFAIVLVLALK